MWFSILMQKLFDDYYILIGSVICLCDFIYNLNTNFDRWWCRLVMCLITFNTNIWEFLRVQCGFRWPITFVCPWFVMIRKWKRTKKLWFLSPYLLLSCNKFYNNIILMMMHHCTYVFVWISYEERVFVFILYI